VNRAAALVQAAARAGTLAETVAELVGDGDTHADPTKTCVLGHLRPRASRRRFEPAEASSLAEAISAKRKGVEAGDASFRDDNTFAGWPQSQIIMEQ